MKYEYKVIETDESGSHGIAAQSILDRMGNEGWFLVQVFKIDHLRYTLFLRKEIV